MSSSVREKKISIDLLKDLVIQFLVTNNFVADNQDIVNFKFHLDKSGNGACISYDTMNKREIKIITNYGNKET